GYISSVLPTVENNTIEFLVALEAPDHQSLRPNMRVEVFIISDKKQDVLRVANGSAFSGAVEQNIFVLRGEKAIKESVRVGLVSMDYVEILSNNIQEGDRIIISDMEKYDHLETITLND
ncbi:MAG: HlyD family secretion protein, partial [Bacteroidota bacterium]